MQDSNLHTDEGKLIEKEKTNMRKGKVTINGVEFELFKAYAGASVEFDGCGADYDEIKSVYGRPSEFKIDIWHEWCEWCYDLNKNGMTCELWIDSHSCFSFSIRGRVQYNGHVYKLWITRDHNRAYIIE